MHACYCNVNCFTCTNKKNTFYKMLCKYCALSLVLMQLANCKLSVAECGVAILCLTLNTNCVIYQCRNI